MIWKILNVISNELYREKRLQEFLNESINLNVKDNINEIKHDIDRFLGVNELFDDITMLELLYKNNNIMKKEFRASREELQNCFFFKNL